MAMSVTQMMWRMYRPHRQQAGSYKVCISFNIGLEP
jgi:hypothetical protein